MGDVWWPSATRDVLEDCGPFLAAPAKGVLHTTEGGSYGGARDSYVANRSAPHFTVSFESGSFQAWQHIPLDQAARALERPGNIQTNRAHAIQIEIVGFADAAKAVQLGGTHVTAFGAPYLAGLAELMRWVEANAGVRNHAANFLEYPASSGNSSVRFTAEAWMSFDGWCGHQHVPDNSHGDPGNINIAALVSGVAGNGGTPPPPPPASARVPGAAGGAPVPGGGIWVVGHDGGVFSFDGAPFHQSLPAIGVKPDAPIVAIVPHGRDGYWLVGADGGVFAFGDAPPLNVWKPLHDEYLRGDRSIVGAAAVATETLTLVADDGADYTIGPLPAA